MKTLISLSFVLISLTAKAEIRNFHPVTESQLVLRGAQPLGKAAQLVEAGVQQVLIFKNDGKGEVAQEINQLVEAGFAKKSIHHIPMQWKDLNLAQACKQTVQALKVIAQAEAQSQTIFFHCTAGEDRTGMLAGLYRMVSEGLSRDEAFASELCDRGYSDGNKNKPNQVVSEIEKGLTPLFMALASRIEERHTTTAEIGIDLCRNLEVSFDDVPTCH